MALGVEWRDQIASIIHETERNLGVKSRPPPRPSVMPRPAPVPLEPQPARVQNSDLAAVLSAAESRPLPEVRPLPGVSLDPVRSTHTRLLESVKFELDVRGKHASAQLDAVREEMQTSMQATERKWMDIAKQMESSIASQVEAEAKLRAHSDSQLTALRDASSSSHHETVRMVSEFQQTAIDHSEVLRRLDADLTGFRQRIETRLAEESRRLTTAIEAQELSAKSAVTANETQMSSAHESRLAEMENALLQERDFRKVLERQISELRDSGGPMAAMEGMVDNAVAAAVESSGSSEKFVSLDEKVKECGRLIVRMGTELMEETKRRQSLEAELQELRMRLSGVEAVARSPLSSTPYQAPPQYAQPYPPNSVGTFSAHGWPGGAGVGDNETFGGVAPETWGGGMVDEAALGSYADGLYGAGEGSYGSGGGGLGGGASAPPFMSESMASTAPPMQMPGMAGGAGRVVETWDAGTQGAVDAKLRELVPSMRAAGTACAAAASVAAAAGGLPEGAGAQFGLHPRGGTSSLRISRQELDARVQQILGRHGQAPAGGDLSTPSSR
uniref:Uncharacterized protein n=1 Tax=Haptolina ericina TaxID=156174 RepID=A0A7S3AZG2_9EUKA|mmetsp:Transcript_43880/g.99207  ORF Transcript_43880/g.99207 Transcript_43880/m.99207 type:complete len:558 (+) Transcript_43880:244-1917(+)